MIIVYFETRTGSYAEIAGVFSNQEVYEACMPAIHKIANQTNYIITENHSGSLDDLKSLES